MHFIKYLGCLRTMLFYPVFYFSCHFTSQRNKGRLIKVFVKLKNESIPTWNVHTIFNLFTNHHKNGKGSLCLVTKCNFKISLSRKEKKKKQIKCESFLSVFFFKIRFFNWLHYLCKQDWGYQSLVEFKRQCSFS